MSETQGSTITIGRSYHLEAPETSGPAARSTDTNVGGMVLREREVPVPGPTGVVVRVRAVSINRRDELILSGRYPLAPAPGVVPMSDGAGEVVAVGEKVTRFGLGDRVMGGYWPQWLDGRLRDGLFDQLGCTVDGMLAEYVVLDEQAAVGVPDHLSWEEAATLPCAALTAWNSVTGGEPVLPGQTVLTLGSGVVSLFAIQFGKMLGCRVIATTSSDEKVGRLKAVGADDVVNYAKVPAWSEAVRELTGGRGADVVVETCGPETINQSVRATAFHGQIVLLRATKPGGNGTGLTISDGAYASSMATIRRVFVGSRADFEAMNRAVSAHRLHPVIDRTFDFTAAHEAFHHYLTGKTFGKVVITIP
ncbi:alcohol dehydrogenase [Microtetraspora sp. NBRC 13810]|uniref:zinc-dependent alcohol dehydrogenase family protein n=1 Tax=Microtetraspora sp. NBRC 13810 TaxID=3030990 RepID=UPI0024A322B0|nr:NAD(P)-dependent alcohol dehydrogenase [Microtetraspora sp. NBRC 13810]GLW07597.1 alcohol dehydrogenase [Microtetraspora sp. NBRC 13810]